MPRITIDQREIEVPAGSTILDAAERLGIEIPTLCFSRQCEPSTSCLVCLVKLLPSGRIVAGLCHAGGRGHAGRKRDGRDACGPPQHAGTAPERPPGRLRGPLLVRLPGADEHSADAPPDRGGRAPRGPDHGQGRYRPAGRAGADLPGPLRKGLPPRKSRRLDRDLRTQADRGRRRSGLGGPLSAALPARVGQAGGDCRRRAGRVWRRPIIWPKAATPARSSTTRIRWAGCSAAKSRPRSCPATCSSARSPRSCGWALQRN